MASIAAKGPYRARTSDAAHLLRVFQVSGSGQPFLLSVVNCVVATGLQGARRKVGTPSLALAPKLPA